MTTTAALWLVYQLSGSPFQVGLVGFANQIPVFVLAPFAGVWVERMDSLRVVRATQVLSMLQSAALAALALSGHITVPWIISLCLFQGFVNAVDWPARQMLNYPLAGGPALVDNVIALNSMTFNLARLIGPAIAGFVINATSPGFCFAVDALSYVAVLVALAGVTIPARTAAAQRTQPWADLREGINYAVRHPTIRRVLLIVPVVSLAGFAHSVLAPVFAEKIFLGDARTLGFLMSATGVGALLAALSMSFRSSSVGLERVATRGTLVSALGLGGLLLAPNLTTAVLCFAAAGAGGVLVMASSNTLLQTTVADDKRGRVMSLFTAGQSLFPIGSLLIGLAATAWGAPATTGLCGGICATAALVFQQRLDRGRRAMHPLPNRET